MANATPSGLTESNTNADDETSSVVNNEENSSSLNVEKKDSGQVQVLVSNWMN